MVRRKARWTVTVAATLLWAPGALGQVSGMHCPDANLWGSALITNICWSCLFPIRVMGTQWFDRTGTVPPGVATDRLCNCDDGFGLTELGFVAGFWAPVRLIEVVRKPYCSPALSGTTLSSGSRLWGMSDGPDRGSASNQYFNYHYFAFPLYEMLGLLSVPECDADGYSDFDLMYMSELDPTWSEDELAMFTNPEATVLANPLVRAACVQDCAQSTINAPSDALWWCAGCWGDLYPFTGNVPSGGGGVRVSSLLSTRALASLHRRGLARRTTGNDVVCGGEIHPTLPKGQYRMSLLFPVPEADNNRVATGTTPGETTGVGFIDSYNWTQGCCHAIGVPTALWGEWRQRPGTGEDFVYMLWRWSDCCIRPGTNN